MLLDMNIRIDDYTRWKTGKNFDGGAYSFTVNYEYSVGRWYKTYTTSSEFFYCPYCGQFGNPEQHLDCQQDSVSEEGVLEHLRELSKKYIISCSYTQDDNTLVFSYEKEGYTDFNKIKEFVNIVAEFRTRVLQGDIKKIRRRLEDNIRKSKEWDIFLLAKERGVKTSI